MNKLAYVIVGLVACSVACASASDEGTAFDGEEQLTTSGAAFTATSYWNTPLDALGKAPVDGRSGSFISALKTDNCKAESNCGSAEIDHLRLSLADSYGQPFWFATSSDPSQTVTCAGRTVTIRIPAGAKPQTGNDGEMTIFDAPDDVVAGFHHVVMSGGKISSCDGLDKWHLDSNGLVYGVAGGTDKFNSGHRGVPAPVRGVQKAEVTAGAINHRLECFLYATGGQTSPIWPMNGFESGRGGSIPEGVVMRIKASVDIASFNLPAQAVPIAKALQTYGCLVGDNSGSGTTTKLQAFVTWSLTSDALAPIKWDNWEFVKAGYDPTTGAVH